MEEGGEGAGVLGGVGGCGEEGEEGRKVEGGGMKGIVLEELEWC